MITEKRFNFKNRIEKNTLRVDTKRQCLSILPTKARPPFSTFKISGRIGLSTLSVEITSQGVKGWRAEKVWANHRIFYSCHVNFFHIQIIFIYLFFRTTVSLNNSISYQHASIGKDKFDFTNFDNEWTVAKEISVIDALPSFIINFINIGIDLRLKGT